MPGSPPSSSTEPRTKPPPVTRSNSAMPEARRGASWVSPDSGSSAKAPALARRPAGAGGDALGAFLGDRVPLAAGVALALPAAVVGAAVLADEAIVATGHVALSGDSSGFERNAYHARRQVRWIDLDGPAGSLRMRQVWRAEAAGTTLMGVVDMSLRQPWFLVMAPEGRRSVRPALDRIRDAAARRRAVTPGHAARTGWPLAALRCRLACRDAR